MCASILLVKGTVGWLLLDSGRCLRTKEREGLWSVEDRSVPSSSLDAGSESCGSIMGLMERGPPGLPLVVLVLAPSQFSHQVNSVFAANYIYSEHTKCRASDEAL